MSPGKSKTLKLVGDTKHIQGIKKDMTYPFVLGRSSHRGHVTHTPTVRIPFISKNIWRLGFISPFVKSPCENSQREKLNAQQKVKNGHPTHSADETLLSYTQHKIKGRKKHETYKVDCTEDLILNPAPSHGSRSPMLDATSSSTED